MKNVILTLSLVLASSTVLAYPGFSRSPISGTLLQAADDTDISHVISEFAESKSFELTDKDPQSKEVKKVKVTLLMSAGAAEADPEIPMHLVVVRADDDESGSASASLLGSMFIVSAKKVASNRLHIEGSGGSAYGCDNGRSLDIDLISAGEQNGETVYQLRYLNVVDTYSGDRCKDYDL